jgi:hypothetical protein
MPCLARRTVYGEAESPHQVHRDKSEDEYAQLERAAQTFRSNSHNKRGSEGPFSWYLRTFNTAAPK